MKFKWLFLVALIPTLVLGQEINARWLGTWLNGDQTLKISADSVNGCKWTGSEPKEGYQGCASFYSGSVKKSQLLDLLQADTALVAQMAKDKNQDAAELAAFRNQIRKMRGVLDAVSNDAFRIIVQMDLPFEGSGDCSSFIFLDKSTIYSVSYCDGGPGEPSFLISPYRRANL
ncbi:MAG: hypothetical protein EBR18_00585 [Betaproteobacteria bacterium]|nr:hypothetical protein [Betaproteobacteria bacterium]